MRDVKFPGFPAKQRGKNPKHQLTPPPIGGNDGNRPDTVIPTHSGGEASANIFSVLPDEGYEENGVFTCGASC